MEVREEMEEVQRPNCSASTSKTTETTKNDKSPVVHEGKKPFKCTICNKSYSRKQILDNHKVSIHERTKNFNDKKCSLTFFSQVSDGNLSSDDEETKKQAPKTTAKKKESSDDDSDSDSDCFQITKQPIKKKAKKDEVAKKEGKTIAKKSVTDFAKKDLDKIPREGM